MKYGNSDKGSKIIVGNRYIVGPRAHLLAMHKILNTTKSGTGSIFLVSGKRSMEMPFTPHGAIIIS